MVQNHSFVFFKVTLTLQMWKWTVLLFCDIIVKVYGYSNGYFPEACESMSPIHTFSGDPVAPQDTQPPFHISIFENDPEGPITGTETLRSFFTIFAIVCCIYVSLHLFMLIFQTFQTK